MIRRVASSLVGLGLVITLFALANLYRIERGGCDPGNPPESCGGAYAVLLVGLVFIGLGAIGVLWAMAVTYSRREQDAA
ncbi:MAG: hypothetical protein WDA27_14570 [Actinomycetota bacterium]